MNCGIQRDIHQTSSLGKTDWDLRQKRRFHVWKFWRFSQIYAVLVILFLCYCLFFMLYIALIWSELICLDSLRFIPTWLRMKSLRWVNIQQCYFWLFPEALDTLYSVFSNVLQTSTNTLNLSMSFFCGLDILDIDLDRKLSSVFKLSLKCFLFFDCWYYPRSLSFILCVCWSKNTWLRVYSDLIYQKSKKSANLTKNAWKWL